MSTLLPGLALLLVLLASTTTTVHGAQDVRTTGGDTLLPMVVDALDKLAEYYEASADDLNLDGFFGARLAEGQLKGFLNHVNSIDQDDSIEKKYLAKALELQKRFQDIADDGAEVLSNYEPRYYENMGFVLEKRRWEEFYPFRTLNVSALPADVRADSESINEKISDHCIGEELYHGNCEISSECWSQMTQSGYIRYSLTHQILYLIIASQYGCKEVVAKLAEERYHQTVDQLEESMCANCLQEAKDFAQDEFPMSNRDIFLEQIAICGYLGYTDFVQRDWLTTILEWQKPIGCFEFNSSGRRKKRENWDLADGCATHGTAVAAAALVQYYKYLLHEASLSSFDTSDGNGI